MLRHMKTIILAAMLLSLAGLTACSKQKTEAVEKNAAAAVEMPKSSSSHRAWYGFEEGMALAEAGDKHIIIDFYTDWCKWCKVMDEKTFSVPEVEAYLFENFIPIRIDAESEDVVNFMGQDYSYRQLTGAFGVTGFPSLAYLTPRKEMITVIPGYVEKEPFMDILSYISKECYAKNIAFETFKENGDCQ